MIGLEINGTHIDDTIFTNPIIPNMKINYIPFIITYVYVLKVFIPIVYSADEAFRDFIPLIYKPKFSMSVKLRKLTSKN